MANTSAKALTKARPQCMIFIALPKS